MHVNVIGIQGVKVLNLVVEQIEDIKRGSFIKYDASHWGGGISNFEVTGVNFKTKTIHVIPTRTIEAFPSSYSEV